MSLKRITTITLAFLLILLAVYISMLAYSDILDSRAADTIQGWQNSASSTEIEQWSETLESLKLARQLDPENGEILEKTGLLYRYKSFASPRLSKQYIKNTERALSYFRQAAEKRPAWAPAWARIIQTKHSIWQFDEEMELAIINAAQLGSLFENVQPVVLRAGADAWPFLSDEGKAAVIEIMKKTALVQPRDPSIMIALNSSMIDDILAIVENDPQLSKIYRQMLATGKRKATQQMKKLLR